jgi:outer membrane protein OmpA-like peptidoglycan-associated protein
MTGRFAKFLLATAAMSAVSGVAHAYDAGWYIRGDLGYSTDTNFSADDDNINWGDVSADEGWLGLLGGGYAMDNGFRFEGELGYRDNDFNDTDSLDQGGSANVWSLMANGYYDFNRGGVVQPYVGLGVGMADVEIDGGDVLPAPEVFVDGSDTVFAWQGMIGLGWQVAPQLTLDLGYRYFSADGVEFDGAIDLLQPTAFTAEGDYDQQAVTVGLRYSFGAPPLPPAPEPPPPPPRETPRPAPVTCPQSDFTIYFEWDRYDLNSAAMDTINAALQRARQCNIAGVQVVGHTDTSGPHDYNQALSERRAGVVRDALVSGGVPANMIAMEGRGETDLARNTPDGVREPLNRRTAVTIAFR